MPETLCFGCGEDVGVKSIVDRGRNTYCLTCFNTRTVSRIRKRLVETSRSSSSENSNVFAPPEPAMLFLDGSDPCVMSNSGLALIELCYQASVSISHLQNNPRVVPFPYKFTIVVVLEDFGFGVGGYTPYHVEDLVKWISEMGMNIPVYVAILGDGLTNSPAVVLVDPNSGQVSYERASLAGSHHDHHEKLTEIEEELKTPTSKNDFIRVLRWRLMRAVAKKLNIRTVFLSDTQTTLGTTLFSLMALGRGSQVANQMAPSSEWNGILTCRLLMDFSDEDIGQYLSTVEDKDPSISSLIKRGLCIALSDKKDKAKKQQPIKSLDGQCADFVGNLQADFPSTVSTLTRIGGKLSEAVAPHQEEQIDPCALCKGNCEQDLEGAVPGYCYGCSTILKEMEHPNLLKDLA